jgi:hypothetical protein
MNIPTYLIGAIIFLVGQTTGAIWWASSLSSEVDRIAGIQGGQHTEQIQSLEEDAQVCQLEIHNLQKLVPDQGNLSSAIKSVDVMEFRLESIEETLNKVLATKIR